MKRQKNREKKFFSLEFYDSPDRKPPNNYESNQNNFTKIKTQCIIFELWSHQWISLMTCISILSSDNSLLMGNELRNGLIIGKTTAKYLAYFFI